MKKDQKSDINTRSLFFNISAIVIFSIIMLGTLVYLYSGSTNIKRIAIENLAKKFATNIQNAHWQWQGEGKPEILMLVSYTSQLGKNEKVTETSRKPIFMTHDGWPKADSTSKGCAKIWDMVLNTPMTIEGFKVIAEYYDGLKLTNNPLDSTCRYRLSIGPYFEYKVHTGQVSQVKS
ncbi:MAG: hypothetical protein ABJH06_03710 [Paraglaciecola sp.]|uniref:hypothetical protein n=1 Tax=Paraglaciecola sp. TaxID=1920173 RepID=UPI0032992596